MRAVGAAVGLLLAGCLEAPPQAVGGGSYRKRLLVPADQVSAPLADFPVLVRIAGDADLAAHASLNGLDLVFLDDGGGLLAFERERWDPGGDLLAWVKVPNLSDAADTEFYLHYGGEPVDRSDRPAVWSNQFALVWHLEEEPGRAADSTATGAHAVAVEGDVQPAAGYLGNAMQFAGSGDYIDFGSDLPAGVDAGAQLTVTGWARYDSLEIWSHFVSKAPTDDNSFGWALGIDSGLDFLVRTMNGSLEQRGWSEPAQPTPGVWYHWALVFDGSQSGSAARLRGFRDGLEYPLVYDATIPPAFDALGGPLYIGCASWNPAFYCIDGAVDEVRVSTVPREPAWIAAEYASQVEGSSFVIIGPEELVE